MTGAACACSSDPVQGQTAGGRRQLTYAAISEAAAAVALLALGGVARKDGTTLILLGPDPARFWAALQASPEARGPDPVDRWSARVVRALAHDLGGEARFPFGTPHQPFLSWALESGACHVSPVGMLVHETQGLTVSFRGALLLAQTIALPEPAAPPCTGCARPCLSACPVSALGPGGYDTDACHRWLDDPRSRCLGEGCAARNACPVSVPRPAAQAAHHMAHFHGTPT